MTTTAPEGESARRFASIVGLVVLAACGSSSPAGTPTARSGRLEVVDTLDFGIVELGQRVERALILRNVGASPLEVESIEVPVPFSGGEGAPATVAPGETLDVTVSFAPAGPGLVGAIARVRAGGAEHEVSLAGIGGASPIRCRPEVVDLGRPVVLTERTFVVSCTVESDASRLDAHIDYVGPPAMTSVPSEWPVVPSGPGTVTFEFTFRPTGLAPVEATIRFRAGAATLAEVQVVAHPIATAVRPIAGFECPGGFDLGFTPPGTTRTRVFVLGNDGDRPLRVTTAEAEGPFSTEPAPPFSIPPDDPNTPQDEGIRELTVAFAPTGVGPASGMLRVSFDDAGTPDWTGCISGVGGGPVLSCTPSSIDFGTVSSAVPRTATVTCSNAGLDVPGTDDDRLRFSTIVAQGAGFSADAPFPAEGLGPGESVAIDVTFAPSATGLTTGTLAVETNAPAVPRLEVPLAGDGLLAGPCAYLLEPSGLEFGPVAANGTPATLPVSIRNVGTEACVVRDLHLGAGTSRAFALRDGPRDTAVIQAGDRLDVPVRFTPEPGEAAGTLVFSISDPNAPAVTVSLSGSMAPTEPCVRIYPESVDFGEVEPGCGSLVATLTVVDICRALGVQEVRVEGASAQFSVGAPSPPATSAAGAGLAVPISYRPSAAGEHLAGFRVTTAEGASRLVPLRGRAAIPSGLETFGPEPAKTDVLFAFESDGDDSHLTDIATYLAKFIEPATTWNIDWQVGTTFVNGREEGRLIPIDGSRPRIARSTDPDAVARAAANMVINRVPGGVDPGLDIAYRALTPPLIDHADDPRFPEPNDGNLGLLRTNARLAVIVLLEESDQSPWPAQTYVGAMGAIKRDTWRQSRFVGHAIAGDAGTGCIAYGGGMPGDKLISWSSATGGLFISICSGNWETEVTRLGLATFGRHRFLLKGRPAGIIRPSSGDLRVYVDGLPWAADDGDWSWDEAANAVVFKLGYGPPPTSTVQFRYTPECLTPAG